MNHSILTLTKRSLINRMLSSATKLIAVLFPATKTIAPPCDLGRRSVGMAFLAVFAAMMSSGCATVISQSKYPVTIDNAGAPTFFSIQDRKQNTIHQGVTPQMVTLDAEAFPFWPAKYDVVFAGGDQHTQRRQLKAGFDPWIAGNILLGGGAGAIIDGATGAMFKLPNQLKGDVPGAYAITEPAVGYQIVQSRLRSDGAMGKAASPNGRVATVSATSPAPDAATGALPRAARQPAAVVARR